MRNAGFDLAVYEQYSKDTQEEVQKRGIKESLRELAAAFRQASGRNIEDIKKGVYVICLSSPFVVRYERDLSEIIYIGRGNILSRLKSHFERSLFGFMQSLAGTNFDFYISEPKKPGPGTAMDYYKHIEYELLEKFSDKIGGGEKKFPLLNKNSGSNKKLELDKGWDLPLKRTGKRPQWELKASKFWKFEKLD